MPAINKGATSIWMASGQPSSGATAKINSFAGLPEGWNYGRGGPIAASIIREGHRWNEILQWAGFPETDAFPGADGEIEITGYRGDHYIEVIIETNSTISIIYEMREETVLDRRNLTPEMAETTISEEIAGSLWSTLDFFTPAISMLSAAVLPPWPSKIPAMDPAHQSSALFVSWNPAPKFASTSDDIMPTWQVNRRSSGYLMKRYYPQGIA